MHEDELWTPLALLKAKDIYVSDLFAYNHFIRENSIMHSKELLKKRKESLGIICPILFSEYRKFPPQVTKYLKDRCVNLYLQTMAIDRHTITPSLKSKLYLLSNACRIKTISKALLFFLSSHFYCVIHDIFTALPVPLTQSNSSKKKKRTSSTSEFSS